MINLNNIFAKNTSAKNFTKNNTSFFNNINFRGNLKKDTVSFTQNCANSNDDTNKDIKNIQRQIDSFNKEIETLLQNAPEEKRELEEKLKTAQEKLEQATDKKTASCIKGSITKYKNSLLEFDDRLNGQIDSLKAKKAKLEEFLNYQKTNPEIAFLFNPYLEDSQKEKLIQKSDSAFFINETAQDYGISEKTLITFADLNGINHDVCYSSDNFQNLDFIYFKTEDEKSKYEDFIEKLPDCMNAEDLLYSLSDSEDKKYKILTQYIKNGDLIPAGMEDCCLNNDEIDKNLQNFVFDVTNTKNKNFIENYEIYSKNLAKKYSKPLGEKLPPVKLRSIPLSAFKKYGFGNSAHIYCAFKNAILTSKIQKGNKLDLTNPVVQNVLRTSRETNPLIISISDLEQFVDFNNINQAITDDKIEFIPNNLLKGDENNLFIDISTPKNKEFFKSLDDDDLNSLIYEKIQQAKLQYEDELSSLENTLDKREKRKSKIEEHNKNAQAYLSLISAFNQKQRLEIEYHLSKALVGQEEKIYPPNNKTTKQKAYDSLFTAIRWSLCPDTREVMGRIARENGWITKIFDKINNLKELKIQQENSETPQIYYKEIEENTLTRQEKTALKAYYKKVWEIAGTEEFANSKEKAHEIMDTYLLNGIDSVEDDFAKQRIERWCKNYPDKAEALLV